MPTSNLFNGIAVVIDDEIGEDSANINNLIQQIDRKGMPCITYNELPKDDIIDHLGGISFLLLDWILHSKDMTDGKKMGVSFQGTIKESNVNANIEFLKKIKDKYFCPIFIFTNEEKNTVISTLHDNGLYHYDKPNFIFATNKFIIIS